jgi:hypothetical protein
MLALLLEIMRESEILCEGFEAASLVGRDLRHVLASGLTDE